MLLFTLLSQILCRVHDVYIYTSEKKTEGITIDGREFIISKDPTMFRIELGNNNNYYIKATDGNYLTIANNRLTLTRDRTPWVLRRNKDISEMTKRNHYQLQGDSSCLSRGGKSLTVTRECNITKENQLFFFVVPDNGEDPKKIREFFDLAIDTRVIPVDKKVEKKEDLKDADLYRIILTRSKVTITKTVQLTEIPQNTKEDEEREIVKIIPSIEDSDVAYNDEYPEREDESSDDIERRPLIRKEEPIEKRSGELDKEPDTPERRGAVVNPEVAKKRAEVAERRAEAADAERRRSGGADTERRRSGDTGKRSGDVDMEGKSRGLSMERDPAVERDIRNAITARDRYRAKERLGAKATPRSGLADSRRRARGGIEGATDEQARRRPRRRREYDDYDTVSSAMRDPKSIMEDESSSSRVRGLIPNLIADLKELRSERSEDDNVDMMFRNLKRNISEKPDSRSIKEGEGMKKNQQLEPSVKVIAKAGGVSGRNLAGVKLNGQQVDYKTTTSYSLVDAPATTITKASPIQMNQIQPAPNPTQVNPMLTGFLGNNNAFYHP